MAKPKKTEAQRLEEDTPAYLRFQDTGDKGPNTHWVHGENIEITVNMWLKYAQ